MLNQRLQMMLDEQTSQRIDELRRLEPDLPSRSEMIRRLIDQAWKTAQADSRPPKRR